MLTSFICLPHHCTTLTGVKTLCSARMLGRLFHYKLDSLPLWRSDPIRISWAYSEVICNSSSWFSNMQKLSSLKDLHLFLPAVLDSEACLGLVSSGLRCMPGPWNQWDTHSPTMSEDLSLCVPWWDNSWVCPTQPLRRCAKGLAVPRGNTPANVPLICFLRFVLPSFESSLS